jgi:hypothetical protein
MPRVTLPTRAVIWIVLGVLAALLPAHASAATNPAAGLARKAKVKVKLLTKRQESLTARSGFRVRLGVRGRKSRRLKIRVRMAPRSQNRSVLVAKRVVRVRRARVFRVRLRPAGRKLLGCSRLRAVVTIRHGAKAVATDARNLRRPRRCNETPPAPAPEAPGVSTADFERCDFLDPSACMLPFPNDHFTVEDRTQATGRRVNFQDASMPRNRSGKPIRAADYNVSDGFSPGPKIVTHVPGLDSIEAFRATGAPSVDHPERSLAPDSPIVLIDAATGQRRLLWAEIDANPADPADRNLIIRPAANLVDGHRYIVGLRNLKRADGTAISAGRAFALYRDRIATTDPAVEGRRREMDSIISSLESVGIARKDLFLAWDFTVASTPSTTSRMLSIRDRAFAGLGDTNLADFKVDGKAPGYAINPDIPDFLPDDAESDGVRDYAPCSAGIPTECENGEDDRIARVVRGTFVVPCYLDAAGCPPGGRFALDPSGRVPQQTPGNTATPAFTCIIPRIAVDAPDAAPARPSLYGHGLFGGQGEIFQSQLKSMANEHDFLFCATDWAGMATRDVPTAFTALQDLSEFPRLIDHVQQGFLNFLFLGRLMIHPEGFGANAAFRPNGQPVIDPAERLYYDGNSQGGIYGGSLTAIAPDFERAALGVPGMNYSLLLQRSKDFDLYAQGDFEGAESPAGLYDNYPNELERPLILSIIQMLWDRGDPNGYASHITADPLPNTPLHQVLMHVGFGDHQVSDVSATMEARTLGARINTPVLEPGRPRFTDPPYPDRPDQSFFGLAPLGPPGYSEDGSAIVFWDVGPPREDGKGTPPPPAANIPPRAGQDPHESPRRTTAARLQKAAFLRRGGKVVDVCGGPCFADDYTGGGG